MKTNPYVLFLLLFIAAVLFRCGDASKQKEQAQYTCPMHPSIIRDEPGKCPVCGMDLVKKNAPGKKTKVTATLINLLESPNAVMVSSLNTVRPQHRVMTKNSTATGVVTSDSRHLTAVSARSAGRIEKLFVHSDEEPVRKGDRMMEIYSPELVTAQRELLFLLKNDPSNAVLMSAARIKLELLGLSPGQCSAIEKSGQPAAAVTLFSPASGFVRTVLQNGMTALHPGMSVTKGQLLFSIVSTAAIRVEFDVDQQTVPSLKRWDSIVVEPGTPRERKTVISFIQPFLKSENAFLKIRAELGASDLYTPGQFIAVQFTTTTAETWWIPIAAKRSLGLRDIVFVRSNQAFRPREIISGQQFGDWLEVKSGLTPNDSVAVNAQFLVDSDSFIQTTN